MLVKDDIMFSNVNEIYTDFIGFKIYPLFFKKYNVITCPNAKISGNTYVSYGH